MAGGERELKLKNGRTVKVTAVERDNVANDGLIQDGCVLERAKLDGSAYMGPCAGCGNFVKALYINKSG